MDSQPAAASKKIKYTIYHPAGRIDMVTSCATEISRYQINSDAETLCRHLSFFMFFILFIIDEKVM
jgi:hypothetical protein